MSEREHKVRTPLFPLYSEVREVLRIVEGVAKSGVWGMIRSIWDQTGTPQNPVDWSDPDAWVAQRLSGQDAELAQRIWEESGRTVNPRHIYGSYLFINNYQLLLPDVAGIYQINEPGRAFLAEDGTLVREIDDVEGLGELLRILATKPRAKRADLLPEWGDFLAEHSKFGTASTIKDTLRRRLLCLVGRGLVSRDGNAYSITEEGRAYAATFDTTPTDRKREAMRAIEACNDEQREALRDQLNTMPPQRFEVLIRDLLEAMGYEDVVVTKESGDRGVDVVATVQFGITTIREVVQVKRRQGTIGRPILDQLRGALPYHKAIRGTLITSGRVSKGCAEAALFPGAAPITLIDGDRLLDLLIEHEVGMRKRTVPLYEVDAGALAPPESSPEGEEALLPGDLDE